MKARRARCTAVALMVALVGCREAHEATEAGEQALGAEVVVADTRRPLALEPLPDERHGHRAEVLSDGRVLVFGGYGDGNAITRGSEVSHLFDPSTSTWQRTSDLSFPLAFHASAVHLRDGNDGDVYAVGAHCVQRFDPRTQTWCRVVTHPALLDSHGGAAIVGGRLYTIGFTAAALDLATLEVHALPEPPEHHAQDHFSYVAALDGRLHLLGGFAGADFQARTRHVVFERESWSYAAELPFPDSAKFGVCVAHDGALYLIGMGGNARYDGERDAWETLPPSPWPDYRCMAAAFVHDGFLHVLGGLGSGGMHGHDVFDLERRVWVVPDGAPLTGADAR